MQFSAVYFKKVYGLCYYLLVLKLQSRITAEHAKKAAMKSWDDGMNVLQVLLLTVKVRAY